MIRHSLTAFLAPRILAIRAATRPAHDLPDHSHVSPRSQRIHPGTDLRRWPLVRKHRPRWPLIAAHGGFGHWNRFCRNTMSHAEFFGEGLTDWGSTLIQLTWREHKAFVYDRFSFSLLKTFPYDGEGWGLTHDRTRLIMSDGTSYLRFLDPKTFRETRRIQVTDVSRRSDRQSE